MSLKSHFLVVTASLLIASEVKAEWIEGTDHRGEPCAIQVSGPTGSSQRALPIYELDLTIGGKNYLGILLELDGDQFRPFESLLKKVEGRTYSRVVGAPISFWNLGLRTVIGSFLFGDDRRVSALHVEIGRSKSHLRKYSCHFDE